MVSSSLGTTRKNKKKNIITRSCFGIVVVSIIFGLSCFRLLRSHSLVLLYNSGGDYNKDDKSDYYNYNHKSNHHEVVSSSAEQLVLELLLDDTTTSTTTTRTKPNRQQKQQQGQKTVPRSKLKPLPHSPRATIKTDENSKAQVEQHHPQQQVVVSETDDIYKIEYELPIVIEKYKLIFFVIPKVASTTFKILLHKLELGMDVELPPKNKRNKHWPRLHFPRLNKLNYLNQYNISYANKIMTDPNWTRAIFFRNPHERLLSVFLDKGIAENFKLMRNNCCPKGKHDYCIGTKPTNSATPPTTATDDQQIQLLGDFVTLLETINVTKRHNNKKKDCLRSNNHWKPQSERVPSKVWPYMNFIGHMENLNQDMELLMQRIHSPLSAATLLSTSNSTAVTTTSNMNTTSTTTTSADYGNNDAADDDDDKRRRRKRRISKDDDKKKDVGVVDGQHHATDSKSQVEKYFSSKQLIDRVTRLYQQDYDSPYLKLDWNLIPQTTN